MASSGPLKTLFDKMNARADGKDPQEKPKKKAAKADATDIVYVGQDDGSKVKKRLSVERIYQKKSQLEHILLRPDTYIGSVEPVTQPMWVMDEDSNMMVQREVTYVPGLYKIFDEILVNAADNKQRDPHMNCIKIDIDPETHKIKIWNNGRGIPVVEHKTEKMYVPTMIFGHLLTSSNYNDAEKKVTGGRNGYGAKLCNIFSSKFIVETLSHEYGKSFKQTWTDNMGKTKEPSVHDVKSENDYTSITFYPDLTKFKMETLDRDIIDIFTRRAYDIAAASKGVRVFLNGKRLPVKNFRDYVDLFIKDKTDEAGAPLKVVHEHVNDRWEVAITMSEKGFQQASFVNSIATTKGGRHVDHVVDPLVTKLIEIVKKKNKGGVAIKPFQIKSHLWVFVSCLIENPTFDSQTKENMTLQVKGFGSKCVLSEKFITQASKCGIVESILSWMKFKAQTQLNKKCHSSKHSKLKGIPKLDDANDAGTKNSSGCTLILTEGDSAKTLAVAGLGVVGRDRYGVFPLRGKVLNVREATHKQIMDNAEINNVIKIMGLHFKEKYESYDSIKSLRYGKLMIMTDQDQDGSHIKGLLINFMHHFWPNLLKHNIIEEFITPIVKVTKGKNEFSFYSLPEFEEWKLATENWHTWKVKYYKGLGTSTSKEAKEYFTDMLKHKIPFKYKGTEDDASINLAFSKKKIEERKEWLTNWMEERKRRSELGLPELYLYGKETRAISYNDFINRELILFSNMDNVRSIPSLVDGLKPGQRKVMFTCFKRNLNKEMKVAQLAGSVAEHSAYHHGEQSLMSTIINLAQNFVGSNNVNLLQPCGQFGTRLHGGKDAASPRYIFTMLSPLARILFNINDDYLLKFQFDDNQKIEPEWYCPIVPTVLINGAEGIGTGWSTKIPNYDTREVVANIKRMIDGLEPISMLPSYKNFRGVVEELGENRYIISGEISIIDDQTIEITELPIKTWTQSYKEDVLEPMLHGTEKTQPMITDYKEYHTDTTVKFVVKMSSDKLLQAEEAGLHKVFKLQSTISTSSMVLFDHNGCIRRYNNVEQIMREFFELRLEFYKKRKAFLVGMLSAESLRLDNIARFIMEKIEGTIVIENKPKKELIQMLVRKGYDPDPIKAWKESQSKLEQENEDEEDDDAESTASGSSGPDFNYILSMALWCLTKEKKDELIKQKEAKAEELTKLRRKEPSDMWLDDLENFLTELDRVEQLEKEDAIVAKPIKTAKGRMKPAKVQLETKPSPMGRRVEPRIDSAMKLKAMKVAAKSQRMKDKKDGQKDMFDFLKKEDGEEQENTEPKSLAERLQFPAAEKKQKKPRAAGSGGGGVRKQKESPSPKKGKKKRNPWSDDSESETNDISISDEDENMDGSFLDVIPRERGPRRAAASKITYKFEEDDGENASENGGSAIVNGSEDEGSFKPDISDDEEDLLPKKKVNKPVQRSAPPKKASPLPSASDTDGDDDDDDSFDSKKVSHQNRKAPKKQTPVFLESDEDDDLSQDTAPNEGRSQSPESSDIWGGKSQSTASDIFGNSQASTKDSQPMFDSDKEEELDLFKPTEVIKKASKPAAKRKPAEKKTKSDPSQPSIASALSKKSTAAKVSQKSKPKISKVIISSSEDDMEIDSIQSKESSSIPDKPPKEPKEKKPRKPKKKEFDSDMSDSDKPKKKKAKRPAKTFSDSDMSENDFVPSKKGGSKKKKMDSDEDDFDIQAFSDVQPRSRGGRAKAIKYFDSDEEDDFDDY